MRSLKINKESPESKALIKELFQEAFFPGFDPKKVDGAKLLASLQRDAREAEARGEEPEPSEASYAIAGLTKRDFLLLGEKAAASLNKHSVAGKQNRKKIDRLVSTMSPEFSAVKDHMKDLSKKLNRTEITNLSREWDLDLQLFRCVQCTVQQKDCEQKLKKCGGCGEVFYCSKECQKIHWRAGHKTECGVVSINGKDEGRP